MRLAGNRRNKDILLANYSLGRTGINLGSFGRRTLPLTNIGLGKMRPFYSLFLLTSWHPIGLALVSFRQCSKRMIHSHSPRVFKSAFLSEEPETTNRNFITNLIEDDIKENKNGGLVVTRFPPEPNGYLHLGHAKSICFNFGVAKAYSGVTHMRFDDTNPAKEEMEYVRSILDDVRWLLGDSVHPQDPADPKTLDPWFGPVRHASDYFHTIHEAAVYLIKEGLAYVDDLTPEEMREYRGTLTEPGKNSPYRSRSIEENLRLFEDMKQGKLPDGKCILRAKIDNLSPNMNLRDPALYRIKRASHPITGDEWCIYPMYDFAHAMSDALESITHSLCTLEFADHRPLYDWVIDSVKPSGLLPFGDRLDHRPTQTEFSRLNLQYTVLSKRKLIQLVTDKHVTGWNDPRMPTICGVRRRGYPAAAIRLFCERMGVSKSENNIDMSVLEDCVRDTLDVGAPRALAISQPLKVTITNWEADRVENFVAERHPKRAELGTRDIPFSGSVYIDREDFFDTGVDGTIPPPKGFKRLLPGGQVRLKYAYVITCDSVVRNEQGEVVEVVCTYDDQTRAGATPEGSKKAKGIIQWVSVAHAVRAELALFDRLFVAPSPGKAHEDGDFLKDLNPHSLTLLKSAYVEPSLASAKPGDTFQFERLGYFCMDAEREGESAGQEGTREPLLFNRVVTLKDTWAGSAVEGSAAKTAANPAAAGAAAAAVVVPEDVLRIEMRVGVILSAEKHPDADSLYIEQIDCGEATGPRTVISGLAKFIPIEKLVGKKVVVVCNLKPSKMRGVMSEGMVLAASAGSDESEVVELLEAPEGAMVGELLSIEGLPPSTPDTQLKSKSALDAWKRVGSLLSTDGDRVGTYMGPDTVHGGASSVPRKLMTSAGPCTVSSLKGAAIR